MESLPTSLPTGIHLSLYWSLAILSVVASFSLYLKELWARKRLKEFLPPGPSRGAWNPSGPTYHRFNKLIQTYGPMASLEQGRNIHVVIGSYQTALDIMQKHGSELADRPLAVSASELLSGGMRILMLNAGKRMHSFRRMFHNSLQPSAARQYEPIQFMNSKEYILDIIRDPEHHLDHARRYAASVALSIAYGKRTRTSYSDPEVVSIITSVVRLMEIVKFMPWPVDKYPFLRYLPLKHVRRFRKYHQDELELYQSQINHAKKGLADDTADPCFAGYLLENQVQHGLTDQEVAYMAGSIFGAGSDTTAAGLGYITMAAACHPEEQAKAQAQLDAVVGQDRAPSFEDQASLPLVVAFSLEAHRWRPVVPFGFSHRAAQDISYNGYVIPAGAIVTGSQWSILHDPSVFPDPEAFQTGALAHARWGVCVGKHVAERSLFITTAHLLWAFNVAEDPSQPIDTLNILDSPITHPLPFKVAFNPRFEGVRQVLETPRQ